MKPKQQKLQRLNLPGMGRQLTELPGDYCVVDLETTGLHATWDHIIEIGAMRIREGRKVAEFSTLVQPPERYPNWYVNQYITKLTGISNAMLAEAPKPAEALPAFLYFLGSDVIVGYNVGFDVDFLAFQCQKVLQKVLPNDYVDALPLAQLLLTELERHRLVDVSQALQVVNPNAHRALSDVETTWKCYEKLKKIALQQYAAEQEVSAALRKAMKLPEEKVEEQLSLF